MNKYIKFLAIVLSIIIITSCGSNSKMDPLSSDSNITDFTSSTIEDERNTTLNAEITIPTADAKIPVTDDYTFINATPTLEVEESNSSYILKVQLIQNGFGLSGKTVNLKAFSNSNDKYGTFESMSSSTDDQGYAIFIYNAPEDIKAVNGKTITIEALLNTEGEIDENNNTIELSQNFILRFNETELQVVSVLPFIVIPDSNKNLELISNSQQQIIAVNVYAGGTNAPYSEGMVHVSLPAKIVDGTEVGSFESYSVPIVNGVATFNYTGPHDLKALIDAGDTSSTFEFYHEEDSNTREALTISYNPTSDYIPSNYTLHVTSSDDKFTMGLPDKEKTFSIVLKDDKEENVDKSQIDSIKVISKNLFIGKVILDGSEVSGLETKNQNPFTFNIKTNTKSGLVPMDIVVKFTDQNGVQREITRIINIIVSSGPPTAMSISYLSVEHDEERAKFIENFIVTATDTYGNKVNTSPNVATGSIITYAVDGSSSNDDETDSRNKRLYFARGDDDYLGTITPIGGNKANFNLSPIDNIDRFKYVDPFNDKLVLFGPDYIYESLGKWDFDILNNYQLELKDDYSGSKRENLYYAIGNNKRIDPCESDGREYVGFATVDSNGSTLDNEGSARISLKYDYHLTGKDVIIWVNLTGYQSDTGQNTRIGESRKHTLRGMGLMLNQLMGIQ